MEVRQYTIIEALSLGELEADVRVWLSEGWQLVGGPLYVWRLYMPSYYAILRDAMTMVWQVMFKLYWEWKNVQ